MSILCSSGNTPPARPTSHTCDLEALQLRESSPGAPASSVVGRGPPATSLAQVHLPPPAPPPPGQDHPQADRAEAGKAGLLPAHLPLSLATRSPPVPDVHTPPSFSNDGTLEFLTKHLTIRLQLLAEDQAHCWGNRNCLLAPAGCSGESCQVFLSEYWCVYPFRPLWFQ